MKKLTKKIDCILCGEKRESATIPCKNCTALLAKLGEEGYFKFVKDRNKEAMSKLGALGGSITMAKYGSEHFSKIRKIAWKKKKQVDKEREILEKKNKTQ